MKKLTLLSMVAGLAVTSLLAQESPEIKLPAPAPTPAPEAAAPAAAPADQAAAPAKKKHAKGHKKTKVHKKKADSETPAAPKS